MSQSMSEWVGERVANRNATHLKIGALMMKRVLFVRLITYELCLVIKDVGTI